MGVNEIFNGDAVDGYQGKKSKGACATGLRLTMQALGLETPNKTSAYQWADSDGLAAKGWKKVEIPPGTTNAEMARMAPPGAILVYGQNPAKNTRGAKHGHVEMVALDKNGNKKYISDYASGKPGGSDVNRPLTVWVNPSIDSTDPSQWAATRGSLASSVQDINRRNGSSGNLRNQFSGAADPAQKIAPLIALTVIATLLSGEGLDLSKVGPLPAPGK